MNEHLSKSSIDASAGSPDLRIDSVTGVDVSLRIAGIGARAYAFTIDLFIRSVLSSAWYAVSALVYNGGRGLETPLEASPAWYLLVVTPASALYLLYHPVVEVLMRGRTPGKRMVGVRTTKHDGALPGTGAVLVRNIFRIVDSIPVMYGVGLVTAMLTRNNVRIGDLAAGTVLVYDHSNVELPEYPGERTLPGGLDNASAEILDELLQRWPTLRADARHHLARRVLARHAPDVVPAEDDASLRLQVETLLKGARA